MRALRPNRHDARHSRATARVAQRLAAATAAVATVVIAAACGALGGADLAEGVQRASGVRERQQEIDESVMGLKRRECQAHPTNPGCEALAAPQAATRSRGLAPFRGVVPSPGVDATGRYGAGNLLRDDGADLAPGWRSASSELPLELTFELRESVLLDRVAFRQTQAAVPESWAKGVELLLSDSAAAAGYVSAGRWELRQATAPQQFSFRPIKARYARLRVFSRHGDADFVSLGALALGITATDQFPLLTGG